METNESDNLSRDELFEVLKDKSRTSASSFQSSIVLLLAAILLGLNYFWPVQGTKDGITFIIFIILICCMEGWSLLYNYRFKKMIDTIETPDQLLYCYEKKKRYENLFGFSALIIMAAFTILTDWKNGYWIILAAAVGSIIYYIKNGSYLSCKETKIVKQLQELIKKE